MEAVQWDRQEARELFRLPRQAFNHPPLLNVDEYLRRQRWQMAAKRGIDIIVAAILLCVLAPLLIVVAIAIQLDSPGPALFTQLRWEWQERLFRCYKFRTMYVAAAAAAGPWEANGRLLKLSAGPRVTRVGGWLRRTSIDELPQLWNVLRGGRERPRCSMSPRFRRCVGRRHAGATQPSGHTPGGAARSRTGDLRSGRVEHRSSGAAHLH